MNCKILQNHTAKSLTIFTDRDRVAERRIFWGEFLFVAKSIIEVAPPKPTTSKITNKINTKSNNNNIYVN